MPTRAVKPEISVVVPTFNRLRMLRECVASVVAQEGGWELLIIDDASEDGTWPWLRSLADPRVAVTRMPSRAGRSAARNAGLAEARAPMVVFLDDDDRLRRRALAQLAATLKRHPQAVAAVGARWKFGPSVHRGGVRISHPRVALQRTLWPELLAGWAAVPGQVMIRTSDARAVGGFEPALQRAEDRAIALELARRGPFALLPSVVLDYREHPGNTSRAGIAAERAALFARFISGLPASDRRTAERARIAGAWWLYGREACKSGRPHEAVGFHLRALSAFPALARSPVVGPGFMTDLARAGKRALVGSRLPRSLDGVAIDVSSWSDHESSSDGDGRPSM